MRTAPNLDALCTALTTNCGDFFDACLQTGLSVQFVTQWQADDPDAERRIIEATRVGGMRLESAAIRRAVHGIMQPVFYQGDVVGYKSEYSDGLLQTLLKGRMAHIYAPDSEAGSKYIFNGPTQINNMPRADTYEDWLRMKGATPLASSQPQLPAPDVIDVSPAAVAAFRIMAPPEPAFAGINL